MVSKTHPTKYSDAFEVIFTECRKSVYSFCKYLGYQPTNQQRQLLDAAQEAICGTGKRKIAVASGQGPGKTSTSAIIGLWLVIRHKNAKLIVTAPSMAQCKDVWLSQARKHLDNPKCHPILKRMYNFQGTGFGCFGRKPNTWGCMLKTARANENARGQHEEHMYIIVEEASGVEKEIIDQYKGTLKNADHLLLQISNPTKRDCDLFDCFHANAEEWKLINWNGEETPNSSWFNQQQNESLAREFGRESNTYKVNVLGQFPGIDPDCLFSEEIFDPFHNIAHRHTAMSMPAPDGGPPIRAIAIDYSNKGGDESVIIRREGNAIMEISAMHNSDPYQTTNAAFLMQERAGWTDQETIYVPDAVGMGQGIIHRFKQNNKQCFEFMSHKKAKNRKKYKDMATEAWFSLHSRMTVEKQPFYIPRDTQMIKQLTGRQYDILTGNIFTLEPKKVYKSRTKQNSPDRADALVQALYNPAISSRVRVAS